MIGNISFFILTIVDGMFVGNGVGTDALGAVSLAMPFVNTVWALSTLFNIGGVAVASVRLGRDDTEGANQAFMHSLSANAVLFAAITLIGTLFSRNVASLLGANETYIDMVSDYIFWYSVFLMSTMIGPCFNCFARNDGNPGLSLAVSFTCTAANIFGDWLMVYPLKWIGKAAAQTEKLTELVNSLVSLSRMDEGEGAFSFSEFNASEAAEEIADSFSDYALSCGHALDAHIEPDVIYRGDEYAVRRLISVLLDNAVKYASDGSRISFSLDRSKKGIVIKTSNECDGIGPGDLDKLFDRFFRADRSHSSEKSGFGIGLSIARAVAEGHGGSICAKSPDGKTVEFTAELKSAPRKTRRMR